jgi:hypothetical protein
MSWTTIACLVGIVRLSLSSSHNYVCCTYCVDLSCTLTIEPQCACCACYEGLLCCRSPDGRTRIDTSYAGACTRVECGGLSEPLRLLCRATFLNNFFRSIFCLIVLCGIIYLYILPSGLNNYIKLYSAWKSGKLN